jgi:hypothetical protein
MKITRPRQQVYPTAPQRLGASAAIPAGGVAARRPPACNVPAARKLHCRHGMHRPPATDPPAPARAARALAAAVLLLAMLTPAVRAQEPESRVLPAAIGAATGVLGGGYLALTVIVAEARMGRYVHEVDDVLGWRSLPVIVGGVTGAALGIKSPRRLEGAIIYGTAGLGLGALAGWGTGSVVSNTPEARWAGAAIGAGLGLAIGNLYGIINPLRREGESGIIPFFIVIPL